MTHTYHITGMTCNGCLNTVKSLLSNVKDVNQVAISLADGTADISMSSHIPTPVLQGALKDHPKYQLTEEIPYHLSMTDGQQQASWFVTYKPILLISGYLIAITVVATGLTGGSRAMTGMRIFMSGFFLIFSFFKLLNLKGFAESYSMYDIVAKKFNSWGYIYAFIELALGLAYALNVAPAVVNACTLIVTSVSLIGVLQSVLNKRKIQCACLGTVFNLPMSTVTIVEDGLMILMSAFMLANIVL